MTLLHQQVPGKQERPQGRINRQVPLKISLIQPVKVLKVEAGVYYHLHYKNGAWHYDVGQEPSTRPLPRAVQGKLNMLAEHYERELQALRAEIAELRKYNGR